MHDVKERTENEDDADDEIHQISLRTTEAASGLAFVDLVRCVATGGGDYIRALRVAESQFRKDDPLLNVLKASIAMDSASNLPWGGALVSKEGEVFTGFVQHVRSKTVLAQVDAVHIPFRMPAFDQALDDTVMLETRSIVALVTLSRQQVRYWSGQNDILLRDTLADALAFRQRGSVLFIWLARRATHFLMAFRMPQVA